MAYSVTLPELGESVTEGTVTRWLKQEGDRIEVDEPLLEISTDKVDTEVPSPVAGTVLRISAQEDETVEVGGELAVIDDGSGGAQDSGSSAQQSSAQTSAESSSGESSAQASEQPAEPQQDTSSGSGQSTEWPAESSGQASVQTSEQPSGQSGQANQQSSSQQSSGSGSAAQGTPVTLPELGESVTEGTVTRWLKQVGDTVEADEPLLEISTDKVDTEVPSPVSGTVLEISAQEDETVEVGGQLAVIGSADAPQQAPAQQTSAQQAPAQQAQAPAAQAPQQDAPSEPQQEKAPQERPQREAAQQEAAQQQQAPSAPATQSQPESASAGGAQDGGPYVTPLVRKLAAENNIDLSALKGSGVGGRIRKQDVLAAVEEKQKRQQAPAAAQPSTATSAESTPASKSGPSPDLAALRGTVQKANRIRQITAQKTKESLQISAQLTQVHEVDVTKIAKLRQRAKAAFREREGVSLTFLPFFAKATVEALKQHPNVNASYNEETKEITYHGAVHLGIAVDTEKGLLSVVIHNAGELSLAGLAHRIADLASRARNNKIKPDELSGGTFTVTNIGSNGALFDTPIIVQPQAGMLGTGAVVKRPMVITDAEGNDTIAIRSMAFLPLTYDHRLVDGADAGRFVTTIKQRLEEGNFEDELGL